MTFTDTKLMPNSFYSYDVIAHGNDGQTATSAVSATSTTDALHFRIDLNGDGKTDQVYVYPSGDIIWSFISQGNGQFTAADYSLGSGFDAGTGRGPPVTSTATARPA